MTIGMYDRDDDRKRRKVGLGEITNQNIIQKNMREP